MRKRITSNIIKIFGFILIALYGSILAEAASFKPVESDKIPEILTLISDKVRNNYNRIKTWKGERIVEIYSVHAEEKAEKVFNKNTLGKGDVPKVIREHRKSILQFSLDNENGLLYTDNRPTKPLEYIDAETGRNLGTKWEAFSGKSIVTPEYQLDCSGHRRRRGVVIEQRAVKQARSADALTCGTNLNPVYNPMKSFKAFKNEIWEFFPKLIEVIKEKGKYSFDDFDLMIEKRKIGDITEYRIIFPSAVGNPDNPDNYIYIYSSMIFSSDKGFNMVSYQHAVRNGIQLQNKTWDYELIDGVYLPKKIIDKNYGLDGNLRSEKTVIFENTHINKPIPPETFKYTNLGLKDGDVFIDKILDKEYRYEADTKKLKPVEK